MGRGTRPHSAHVEGLVVCCAAAHQTVGLARVLVSDGEHVVVTDAAGRFILPNANTDHPIFISVPAGYRPLDDFFRRCEGDPVLGFRLVPALESAASDYVFAILADYQWEINDTMRRVFAQVISDPAGPQFIAHLGDLFTMMEGAPIEVARRYYEDYARALREFDLPVYNLIGNHDQVNGPPVPPQRPEFADGLYERVLGPTYYSFDWGEIHFVVLNPFEIVDKVQFYRLSQRQLIWLENDLAHQPADKPLVLLTHRSPMQWENEQDLLRVLAGRRVLACFAGDWHRDAVFRCPGEPFPTIVTVGPLEDVQWMPPGYRIAWVRGDELSFAYRLMHGQDEVYVVRPAPASRVAGTVELVVTEHLRSDRRPAPAYSTDGVHWTALQPQPLPGERTTHCEATWAQWRAALQVDQDCTLVLRAADDSPPAAHVELPLAAVPSPVAWRRPVTQSGDTAWRSQPTVAGPLVVLGEDGAVRAFHAADGTVAWVHREPARWLGTPLVVQDRVVVTSWESDILALRLADGSVLWRARQECAIPPARPAAVDRFVLVGGMKRDGIWDGSLSCLDMAIGAICWSRRYDHPFFSTPLVAPGRLWASCGDVVHCIDVASGDEIWSYYPEHFSLYGPMVLAQGRLFAPDCDGWTYVLDPENGAFLDRFLLPRGTGLTSDGTLIYAACGVRGLCACDPLSYRELWHIGRPGSYFAGGLALREREILAASSDGNVYAVAGGTGRIAWSFQLGDVGGAAVTFDDEHGYVITGGGQLVAFSLPTC